MPDLQRRGIKVEPLQRCGRCYNEMERPTCTPCEHWFCWFAGSPFAAFPLLGTRWAGLMRLDGRRSWTCAAGSAVLIRKHAACMALWLGKQSVCWHAASLGLLEQLFDEPFT